jgi:hypothetical protein
MSENFTSAGKVPPEPALELELEPLDGGAVVVFFEALEPLELVDPALDPPLLVVLRLLPEEVPVEEPAEEPVVEPALVLRPPPLLPEPPLALVEPVPVEPVLVELREEAPALPSAFGGGWVRSSSVAAPSAAASSSALPSSPSDLPSPPAAPASAAPSPRAALPSPLPSGSSGRLTK